MSGVTAAGARPGGRLGRVARGITEALAPSVLAVATLLIVAIHSGAVIWGIVAAVFAVMIPLSYVTRGVRKGKFDNHHVSARERGVSGHRPCGSADDRARDHGEGQTAARCGSIQNWLSPMMDAR